MTPADPVVITVACGNDIIMEAEGSYDIRVVQDGGRTKVTVRDCCSDMVLLDRAVIGYMAVNMPFIGIQVLER